MDNNIVKQRQQAIQDDEQFQDVPEQIDFLSKFPKFLIQLNELFINKIGISEKLSSSILKKVPFKHFTDLNESIKKVIPFQLWDKLCSYRHMSIAFHIYRFFYGMTRDPEFSFFDTRDQNELLWTVLLHDLSKRGFPEVPEGRDRIHPFKSALLTLQIFRTLHIIVLKEQSAEQEAFDVLVDILENKAYFKENNQDFPDVKYLPEINALIKKITQQDKSEFKNFVYDVFTLVLLHQSLGCIKAFRHAPTTMPPQDIMYWFSPRLLYLMKVVYVYDSASHGSLFKLFQPTSKIQEIIRSFKYFFKLHNWEFIQKLNQQVA